MSGWSDWLAPGGVIFAGLLACAQAGNALAGKKALYGSIPGGVEKITTVCYLFCLSAYLTAIAGGWLVWSGQISADGVAKSSVARLAFLVAGESISFERELVVIVALMSIVVVPQLANYFVSGLFGAAGSTKFGAWCLRIVFWSILKGVAIAGGVSVAWASVALYMHWPHAYDNTPQQLLGKGLSQIAASVLSTTFAGPLEDSSLAALRSATMPIFTFLLPIHRWLTRHKGSAPDREENQALLDAANL